MTCHWYKFWKLVLESVSIFQCVLQTPESLLIGITRLCISISESDRPTQIVGDQNYLITILSLHGQFSPILLGANQKNFILVIDVHGTICVYRDICLIMAALSQRQQDRISKSSTDRLRSHLVRSGMEEDKVAQMARGELKAAAAQVEVEKQGGGDARFQPLPDDGDELFESLEVAAPKSREYEVLKMQLQLRKQEIEADK